MTTDPPAPTPNPRSDPAPESLDLLADALYDLLSARARSIGVMDIQIDATWPWLDVELLFTNGPDIGLSLDALDGICSYCVMQGDAEELWLEADIGGLRLTAEVVDGEAHADMALRMLDGLLAARRPLLR